MPSEKLHSRVAQAALCVALTAAVDAAAAQSLPRTPSVRSARTTNVPTLPPPLSAQDPAPPLDMSPPTAADIRGGLGNETPRVAGVPNYGAPRKLEKLPKPYPPRRVYTPKPFTPQTPLPKLEAYKTSPQAKLLARQRGTPQEPLYPPPPTVAVEPMIKVKPRPKVEAKPYDPVGIGIGSLRLTPFVEVGGGYDDNPNRLSSTIRDKRPSALFRGDAGFLLNSNWDRHSLIVDLRGGYSEYFNYSDASRPDANGALTARYDITRDTALDLKGRVTLDTIRPGSPAINAGVVSVRAIDRPITLGANLSPGITQKFNRLEVSLRGSFDRVIYNDVAYSDGSTLDLSRTSYTGFGGGGRVSYEVSPDLKPFIEGTYDRRVHDRATDFNGFYRDSNGFTIRGGAQVNFTDLLKGEASGGYAERKYDDPRLAKLRGPTVDASLIYTPSALTTVTLRGSTTLNETTLADASGTLTRMISAQLSHDLLRNLNVTALGSYFENDYQGTDIKERGYTAGVKLDYKITRSVSLRGSYMHESLSTSYPNADYTANVFLVGLRFQI